MEPNRRSGKFVGCDHWLAEGAGGGRVASEADGSRACRPRWRTVCRHSAVANLTIR
jgi:hypothetical protein